MLHPESFTALLGHRRTLLLQGPMGPFFAKLAGYLRSAGQEVFKVNFNGGDKLFFRGQGSTTYRGRPADWGPWLRRFVVDNRIDAIVLFGQSRPVHRPVPDIARRLGVQVFVFEEGYDRPNHVTLEIGGVNANSPLPRRRAFYDAIPASVLPSTRRPQPTGQTFWRTAALAVSYGLSRSLLALLHRNEEYHRPLSPIAETARWLHGGLRKLWNARADRPVLRELVSHERSGRWFMMPLQVHNDSQILRHSHYPSMETALAEVMVSFANHADSEDWLVIKHHPMDRAYRDYTGHISALARSLGIEQRVRYVHDLHMPTLLAHTRGMVTINSTTGLQALHHGKPVITLGECVYAVEGLVHAGPLDLFWRNPGSVDMQLFYRFRHHLIQQSQLNASFYARVPAFAALPGRSPQAVLPEALPAVLPQPLPKALAAIPLRGQVGPVRWKAPA
ncbi:MAG TPA: capsular biosynthesis protein, partial [Rubrivivax sp.]|nr:capsular biosynthesis protein [Rubrivivax sp.]